MKQVVLANLDFDLFSLAGVSFKILGGLQGDHAEGGSIGAVTVSNSRDLGIKLSCILDIIFRIKGFRWLQR